MEGLSKMEIPQQLDLMQSAILALAARVEALEARLEPEAQKKHTLSILKDVLADQLQSMDEDEFVVDDDTEEEVK